MAPRSFHCDCSCECARVGKCGFGRRRTTDPQAGQPDQQLFLLGSGGVQPAKESLYAKLPCLRADIMERDPIKRPLQEHFDRRIRHYVKTQMAPRRPLYVHKTFNKINQ